jgi:DNA-binding protein WhiA
VSFTATVKDELSRIMGDDSVNIAELSAIVRTSGTLSLPGHQTYRLALATETGSVARATIILLHRCFNLRTELTVRKSVLHKTHNYLITVPPQPVIAEALVLMGVLDRDLGLASEIDPSLVSSDANAAAYLRGAFMAGGSVADPHRDAHLELIARSMPFADGLLGLMSRLGVEGRISKRRGDIVIYLKSTGDILSFMRVVGADSSAGEFERVLQMKSLRNDTNRLVNAEMANQKKSTDAASDQILLINAIDRQVGLAALPKALREFCTLRLEHPELSLRELGEVATPQLSKSAIGHRLRRLEELAVQLGILKEADHDASSANR